MFKIRGRRLNLNVLSKQGRVDDFTVLYALCGSLTDNGRNYGMVPSEPHVRDVNRQHISLFWKRRALKIARF